MSKISKKLQVPMLLKSKKNHRDKEEYKFKKEEFYEPPTNKSYRSYCLSRLDSLTDEQLFRSNLISSYTNELPEITLPTKISDILCLFNKSYEQRKTKTKCNMMGEGFYYNDDFIKLNDKHSLVKMDLINGIANNFYWDNAKNSTTFKLMKNIKPSVGLKSLINGPTIADCGNVLQVSLYIYIMQLFGEEKFDQVFSKSIIQFIITSIIFDKFDPITTNDLMYGNPLYFLFDKVSYDDLDENDFVYIQGVEDYTKKHLSGNGPGWNLLCVRDEESGELKFLGFGPNTFNNGPLTMNELREKLISYYNEDQNNLTKEKIQQYSNFNASNGDQALIHSQAILAKLYENDTKLYSEPIVGIKFILRLNNEKLTEFMNFEQPAWHNKPLELLFRNLLPISKQEIKNIVEFSIETVDKDFDNYLATIPEQRMLLEFAKKFAYSICYKEEILSSISGPKGCIFSGSPGIGKSHLSVAIAKFVSEHGKHVLFIDNKFLVDQYQKSKGKENDFRDWFNDMDLIILDDINTDYGIGTDFIIKALKYVFQTNSNILISSNHKLNRFYNFLPTYISYNSPFANNFKEIELFNLKSFRVAWINVSELGGNKLKLLANFNGMQCAGITIIDKYNSNLQEHASNLLKLVKDDRIKIRIAKRPATPVTGYVEDLYLHDVEFFDICVIQVFNANECQQLFHLISKTHDKKMKIIVIIESLEKINNLVAIEILKKEKEIDRLKDRLRIILPEIKI